MDYDFLPVSDGTGDAALMHVSADRSIGATTILVDTVSGVPTKFIATSGTLLATGLLDPATVTNFKGHLDGANLEIDAYEAGSSDLGHTEGQVIIIKPNTGWANRVASFIKNMTGFGTPENITVAALDATDVTADTVTTTGDSEVGGDFLVNGTQRVATASTASASTITPSAQVYSVTALAATASVAVPSFAAYDGMSLIIRIKDNGTARALSFASGYSNVSGVDTPTTTVANKLLTIGAIYNSTTAKWEIQGINQQA